MSIIGMELWNGCAGDPNVHQTLYSVNCIYLPLTMYTEPSSVQFIQMQNWTWSRTDIGASQGDMAKIWNSYCTLYCTLYLLYVYCKLYVYLVHLYIHYSLESLSCSMYTVILYTCLKRSGLAELELDWNSLCSVLSSLQPLAALLTSAIYTWPTSTLLFYTVL